MHNSGRDGLGAPS